MKPTDILSNLNEEDAYLFILPNKYRKQFLLEINNLPGFFNIKIKTREDIISDAFYHIEVGSFVEISRLNKINYSSAEEIASNLYLPAISKSRKLENLSCIVDHLLEKEYLKKFIIFPKKQTVFIYGYQIDKLFKNALDYLKLDYQLIDFDSKETKFLLSKYKFIFDEVDAAFKYIANLIYQGVNINDIKIHYTSNKYTPYLKLFSSLYQLPLISTLKIPLISFPLALTILNLPDLTYETLYEFLSNPDIPTDQIVYYNCFINVINDYYKEIIVSPLDQKRKMLEYIFTNKAFYQETILENSLIAGDIVDTCPGGKYLIVIGSSQDDFGNNVKDNNNYSESEIISFGLESKWEYSQLKKNNILQFIYSFDNVYFSYLESSLISSIVNEVNPKEYVDQNPFLSLSTELDCIKLGMKMDDFITYNTIDELFKSLLSNYFDIGELYLSYNNFYQTIDDKTLSRLLEKDIKLSASSLESYHKCQFNYLLKDILKINNYKDSPAAELGTLFHQILQQTFLFPTKADSLIDNRVDNFFVNKDKTAKNHYLKTRLKGIIKDFYNQLLLQEEKTSFKLYAVEKEIEVKLDSKYNINLFGKIDKISSYQNHYIIADYKSRNAPKVRIANTNRGIGIQLFFYSYLLVKYLKLKNDAIAGVYYQVLLNQKRGFAPNIKIDGFFDNNEEIINLIDNTPNKEYIGSTQKITRQEFNQIIDTIESITESCINNIENGHFKINPKVLDDGNNISCKFCQNYDICCKSIENIEVFMEEVESDA